MGKKYTEEDVKNYLASIWVFAQENHDDLVRIMELRTAAENCSVRYDKESVQSSGNGDKMTNIVGKIVDLERKIYRKNEKIKKRRAEFEEIAKMMSDNRQREFLTIRYHDGNGFYDTALIMDLSVSTAKRIHRHGISEFTKLINKKHNI